LAIRAPPFCPILDRAIWFYAADR